MQPEQGRGNFQLREGLEDTGDIAARDRVPTAYNYASLGMRYSCYVTLDIRLN